MSFKRFATAGMPDRYRCGCHKHWPPWPGCDGYGRGCEHPDRRTGGCDRPGRGRAAKALDALDQGSLTEQAGAK